MIISCPCGSVKLHLGGEPLAQVYCHCDDCQHAHSAAYVPRALYKRDAVSIQSGDTRSWKSGTRNMVICASCGSHLYGEGQSGELRGVNAGLFPGGTFKPEAHINAKFAVAPVVDNLPHYADFPAEVGGSGLLIGW